MCVTLTRKVHVVRNETTGIQEYSICRKFRVYFLHGSIMQSRWLFWLRISTPFNLKRDDYEASTAEQAYARTGE
ncbi:hypothetical protein DKP76_03975 [Falsochrobactrum shanghaiense]|uniref:Uncharacterized protein n=1 Tax=Falsochrobactrum shanghaiense TaxID=2201899 RepID=A0A316JGF4_9HYPH|nr:hypothetical protein DKP76_03975 [Falsochrobactrum shanghaiense]